jgi:hypothetical protein
MFKKLTATQYPPRLWSLVGRPGTGKTTFAAQMRGPLLVVDADHRFVEVVRIANAAGREVYQLSDTPSDSTDPDRVAAILAANMPTAQIGTIVVDSLTAIIAPRVTQAMQDRAHGREKNLMAGFSDKALAMRQLQDAVTRWGTDALWIYHLQDSRDAKANAVVTATVSATERARLVRSINLQLELVVNGKRGVKVLWARQGRSGMVIYDETGAWIGMPEQIEHAVYDGLSPEDQQKLAQETPTVFANPETAIAWAIERGAFDNIAHARNAYEKLKRERNPQSAREMAAHWIEDVNKRIEQAKSEAQAVLPFGEDDPLAAIALSEPMPLDEIWRIATTLELDEPQARIAEVLKECGGDVFAALEVFRTQYTAKQTG